MKILVIRRDNIGDLVCTTPLFAALRQHYPHARIDALVNSYNGPVLAGNPDLDHVYVYSKYKHVAATQSRIAWLRSKPPAARCCTRPRRPGPARSSRPPWSAR